MNIFVSIIIPVKNEERHIEKCINAVLGQDYGLDCYEILVIDNGSTDSTVNILEKSIRENIILYKNITGTIGAIRNFGYKKSKGEIIAFLDGDCCPPSNWLTVGVNHLTSDNTIGCIGFTDIDRNDKHPWVQQAWQHICSTNKCYGTCDVVWLSSFNLILFRQLFEHVGGFKEDLTTCEDADLGYKMSKYKRLVMSDVIRVHHMGEVETLAEFFKKEYWRGKSNLKSFVESSNKKHDIFSVLAPLMYVLIIFLTLFLMCLLPTKMNNTQFLITLLLMTMFIFVLPMFLTFVKSSRYLNPSKFLLVSVLMATYLTARGLAITKYITSIFRTPFKGNYHD